MEDIFLHFMKLQEKIDHEGVLCVRKTMNRESRYQYQEYDVSMLQNLNIKLLITIYYSFTIFNRYSDSLYPLNEFISFM